MIIDVIFLICTVIFFIKGYGRGIVVALFAVFAIVAGVLGALKLSGTVSAMLFQEGEKGGKWMPFLSYLIVFLLIVWLVRMGAGLIQRSVEKVSLGWFNRLCGAILYVFLVCFVFSSMLWLFDRMGVINPETKSSSHVYPLVEPLAAKVFSMLGYILPFAKHIFDDLAGFFDHVNQRLPDVGAHR